MKKYRSFFKVYFIVGLQYRTAAIAGIITQILWGMMSISMYIAFYQSNPSQFPMTFEQLVAYLWLEQAFLSLIMVWSLDNEIFEAIEKGNVVYELCRPMNLYNMWFVKNVSNRIAKVVLRCIPILIFAFLIPKPYQLVIPSFLQLLFFLFSLFLSLLVIVAFSMLIYITTFFTLSSNGIRMLAVILCDFLSGAIIPLPFFPENIKNMIELLPFASMQNSAFRIFSGNISGNAIISQLALQIFWTAVLIGVGYWFIHRALKQMIVQGG